MTDQEIIRQVEVIREASERVLAGGKEACRQFLIDAGILPGHRKKSGMNKISGCKLRVYRQKAIVEERLKQIYGGNNPYHVVKNLKELLKYDMARLNVLYDELDKLTCSVNERYIL